MKRPSQKLPLQVLAIVMMVLGVSLFGFTPRSELPCLDKTFSVQVHIVVDSLGGTGVSEGDVLAQFSSANGYWDDICVQFEVCDFNYIENFQWDTLTDIGDYRWAELLTAHHQAYRINVVYLAYIEPGDAAGFAPLGGINNTQGGAICVTKGGGAGTLVHEMGHYWGLEHTFEGNGTELADGSNCQTEGDGICDTPGDPYVPFSPSSDWETDCIFDWMGTDANGDFYDPDIGNVMSYYDCACHFSYEQYQRMASVYSNNLQPNGQHMW